MNTTDDEHGEVAGLAHSVFYGSILHRGHGTPLLSVQRIENGDLESGQGESYLDRVIKVNPPRPMRHCECVKQSLLRGWSSSGKCFLFPAAFYGTKLHLQK
jgi:hypothetical protein